MSRIELNSRPFLKIVSQDIMGSQGGQESMIIFQCPKAVVSLIPEEVQQYPMIDASMAVNYQLRN